MKPLIEAIRFLTILPLPSVGVLSDSDFAKSARWIPVAGLLVGLLAAGGTWLLLLLPATLLTAGVITAMLSVISGGLHLDGLADTADGFLSARPRDQIVRIMKDPHIGSMGVLALILVLGLKVLAFASLPVERNIILKVVFIAPLLGRCCMTALLAWAKPARPDGLGALFHGSVCARHGWGAVISGCVAAMLAFGIIAWIPLTLAAITGVMMTLTARSKIGGMSGDVLGATSELVELMTVIGIVIAGLI